MSTSTATLSSVRSLRPVFQWQSSTLLTVFGILAMASMHWGLTSGPTSVLLQVLGFLLLSCSIMLSIAAATSHAVRSAWRAVPQSLVEGGMALIVLNASILP